MHHHIEARREVFRPDHWQGRCSCGWRAPDIRPRQVEALRDADEHACNAIDVEEAEHAETA